MTSRQPPDRKKANKQLLSRVTDNLIHPGVRSRLAPVGLIALWADNDVHTRSIQTKPYTGFGRLGPRRHRHFDRHRGRVGAPVEFISRDFVN